MSKYEQIIDEIVKHGVVVKVNKIVDDNYIPYERKYVGCVVELDFSEHDKVFENEIAGLKAKIAIKDMDYKTASELLGKYQQENKSLKQRIDELEKELEEWKAEAREIKKNRDEQLKSFRKAVKPYVDILHMHETIAELKQRIAELESKETEKPTKINLNDQIKVKLTPLGVEIYYHQYDDLNKKIKENGGTQLEPRMPEIDKGGYTEFQLHHFISLYGEHIGMCKPNVINPLDIVIAE